MDEGVLIVNKLYSLRGYNEKLFTTWFERHMDDYIRAFWQQHLDFNWLRQPTYLPVIQSGWR
ncbi:hypothetical protein [Candidatus Hoaglandella endobia]|uniref:hypothetical protein n=1 Tax=Candidatus Hoaglandella endobia TaxID=1778263 RepID=UPI0008377BAE